MAEIKKLLAKAGLKEIKILGWISNFRELIVCFPENKHLAGTDTVKAVLVSNKTSYKNWKP